MCHFALPFHNAKRAQTQADAFTEVPDEKNPHYLDKNKPYPDCILIMLQGFLGLSCSVCIDCDPNLRDGRLQLG
jgi:hypothetical protein